MDKQDSLIIKQKVHFLGLMKRPCLLMSSKSWMAHKLLVSGGDEHAAMTWSALYLTPLLTRAAES